MPEREAGFAELEPARAATATRARRITPATIWVRRRAASFELKGREGGAGKEEKGRKGEAWPVSSGTETRYTFRSPT